MEINLKLLSTFALVAECGSLTTAAEKSFRSVSAMSMQVKQLEEQLGVTLFNRTTRRLELTANGELLLTSSKKAMGELKNTLQIIQGQASLEAGSLSVACIPTFAERKLPTLAAEFQKRHPGVMLKIREAHAPDVVRLVRDGEATIGIGVVDKPVEGVSASILMSDDIWALVPREAQCDPLGITLSELCKFPLVTLEKGSALRQEFDAALRQSRIAVETHVEVMQIHTLIAMAEAGLGVGLLPRLALPSETKLKAVRLREPEVTRSICIVTMQGQSLSPPAQRFSAFLAQHAKSAKF
jgi:DNA-binding transcriptional LysR family regulator